MHIIPAPDLNIVRQLLHSTGLPTEDIGHTPQARFYLMLTGTKPVAMVGIERYGTEALLRSLMVKPAYRGKGLATQLIAYIQQVAHQQGATTLYLLTTTAGGYFRRLGFSEIARDDTPTQIQQTREFSHLCPQDAILLYRPL